MDHQKLHLLEKSQVQVAAVVACIIVFFLYWPVLKPVDIQSPAVFLVSWNVGGLLLLAGGVWILAIIMAIGTLRVRPIGALAATALGMGGLSLRSARIMPILWQDANSIKSVFCYMMIEVAILVAIFAVATAIIVLVRQIVQKVKPSWVWQNPIKDDNAPKPQSKFLTLLTSLSMPESSKDTKRNLQATIKCFIIALVIAEIMLFILMRSPLRGQILFALGISFLVAMFAANQYSPTPFAVVVCFVPAICAMIHYYLVAMTNFPVADGWALIPDTARALPIDWMTVGLGGAWAGLWISQRVGEMRHISKLDQEFLMDNQKIAG